MKQRLDALLDAVRKPDGATEEGEGATEVFRHLRAQRLEQLSGQGEKPLKGRLDVLARGLDQLGQKLAPDLRLLLR